MHEVSCYKIYGDICNAKIYNITNVIGNIQEPPRIVHLIVFQTGGYIKITLDLLISKN